MEVSDWIDLCALILAIFGVLFSFIQWHKSVVIKRAEFLESVTDRLRYNKEILRTIYSIDYGEFKYDSKFHDPNNEEQCRIDMLLSVLDYICYLLERRTITKKELSSTVYILNRVCRNPEIQCYLWNLYHFSPASSYGYLISYCGKNGILVGRFSEENCEEFKGREYLNF